jgi:mannose-6-phosphate isomerase-like protein (cupin superfamily)
MYVLRQDDPEGTAVWTEQMRGGYARWEPGFECEYHCHEGADEVFVFLAGQCEITVEGEKQVCGAGETVYTRAGQRHKLKAVGDEPLHMFMVVAPNHSPTHTMHYADGRIENHDRPTPERRVP